MNASADSSGPLPQPLWLGRSMALLGILLVAFNVRTAVAALSPILDAVVSEVPLDSLELGVIGTIPPIMFSLSALFGARIARRVGIEQLLGYAIAAMIVGHILRSLSYSFGTLLLGTTVALLGAGLGNVLLPPLVKRYFPDRIGLITGLYVSLVAISTAVPSAMATPVTVQYGWRVSLGLWAVVALVALVPWVVILLRHARERALERARVIAGGVAEEIEPVHTLLGSIVRSRVAWLIAAIFSVTSGHVYSAFAWLPVLLVDIAGVTQAEAGNMLAVSALMGVPTALAIPVLAARMRNVGLLVYAGVAFFVIGYLGLLFAPTLAPWVWVICIGLGPLLFPLALTLINLRSRTHQGSVALSGFSQGIGYAVAALGPLIFAVLHDVSGGWTLSLLYLLATALLAAVAGFLLRRVVYVEDELGHSGLSVDD